MPTMEVDAPAPLRYLTLPSMSQRKQRFTHLMYPMHGSPRHNARVLFNWEISSYFGWGLYGLNLMLAWADRPDLQIATLAPLNPGTIDVDPLELRRIGPTLHRSIALQTELKAVAGQGVTMPGLMLHALGNSLTPIPSAHGTCVQGTSNIGVAFLEHAPLSEKAALHLQQYPLIVAGSSWNQQILEAAGAPRVELVLQGIDTSHFHPAPRRNLFPGRFVVFSGGKLEHRKGQDLVLQAFRIFAERHKEALLLTAWSSPWPHLAQTLGADEGLLPPTLTVDGQLDAASWTQRNGIPENQTVHCGAVPNRAMARILREADVALFPNRAEGGTNLVAMECMASGVPVILSANTGHLDLLQDGTAIALRQQAKVPGEGHLGWGNSNVEEMVEALESVYRDRHTACARARQGAHNLSELTWANQMNCLGDLLLAYLPEGEGTSHQAC